MSTRPLIKTAIVGLAAGLLLLTFGDGGRLRPLAIAVGAALVGFAWVRLEREVATPPAPTNAESRKRRWRTGDERRSAPGRRIDRTPTGRGPRDMRCPASRRATARARRSR